MTEQERKSEKQLHIVKKHDNMKKSVQEGNDMDNQEEIVLSAQERKRQRILRRKKELRIARIKFGIACGVILLAIILIIVGCTKGCKRDVPPEMTTTENTASTTTEATEPPAPTFAYRASDWKLILVNADHPLAEDYTVDLSSLRSGAKVNSQCMDSLQEMFDACRAAGLKPLVISAYQSGDDQQKQYDTRVSELMSMGFTKELAEKEAVKTVAAPGCSEYQTGLLLDIVSETVKDKDTEKLADCAELAWMRENSWKYGFVERYTGAQAARMGVTYQPWQYRFVGKNAAQDMYEQDYCLEELVALLEE